MGLSFLLLPLLGALQTFLAEGRDERYSLQKNTRMHIGIRRLFLFGEGDLGVL